MEVHGLTWINGGAQKNRPERRLVWAASQLETATIALIPALFHTLHERASSGARLFLCG